MRDDRIPLMLVFALIGIFLGPVFLTMTGLAFVTVEPQISRLKTERT